MLLAPSGGGCTEGTRGTQQVWTVRPEGGTEGGGGSRSTGQWGQGESDAHPDHTMDVRVFWKFRLALAVMRTATVAASAVYFADRRMYSGECTQ